MLTWPLSTGLNLGWQASPFQKATLQYQFRFDAYIRDTTTAATFSRLEHADQWHRRRLGVPARRIQLPLNGTWFARSHWDEWGKPHAGEAHACRPRATYAKYSVRVSRNVFIGPFQKFTSTARGSAGSDLDRFVQYQFGMFDDTRIHGVPASGVRFGELAMVRGSYSLNVFELYRLDVFLEHAWGREQSSVPDWQAIPGTGAAVNLRAPWNTILRAEFGKSLLPDRYRGLGSTTLQVLLLKPLNDDSLHVDMPAPQRDQLNEPSHRRDRDRSRHRTGRDARGNVGADDGRRVRHPAGHGVRHGRATAAGSPPKSTSTPSTRVWLAEAAGAIRGGPHWHWARRRKRSTTRGCADSTIDPRRVGIFFGAGTGDLLRNEDFYRTWIASGIEHTRPSDVWNHFLSTPVDAVATRFGFEGPRGCIVAACSSSTIAIGRAAEAIRHGRADVVLAGGTDALARLTFTGFNLLRLMDPEPCRPFARGRDGMNIGEGAGILVLEALDHARRRGAHVYAELAGHSLACEAFHPTAPGA